jgi:AraC family transcriptional regulator
MMGILISAKAPSGAEVDLPLTRGRAPLLVKSHAVTSHILQLLDLAGSKRSSVFTPLRCSSLLMLVIGEVLDTVCENLNLPEPENAISSRAKVIYDRTSAFINSNLRHSLNASALAIQAGVGFRHLTRIFIHHYGVSPHSHVIRLRLKAAQEILDKEPATPLKMVAYECGFSSASHFTATFKKKLGVSPSVYAKRRGGP